jgi:hypothetical protein
MSRFELLIARRGARFAQPFRTITGVPGTTASEGCITVPEIDVTDSVLRHPATTKTAVHNNTSARAQISKNSSSAHAPVLG